MKGTNKMEAKQWINGIVCVAMTMSVPMTTMASNESVAHFSAEEFVTEYYDAVNSHDWEAVASYYDWDKSEEMQSFLRMFPISKITRDC